MPSAESPEPFWALSSQNWQLIINKVLLQHPAVHRSGGGLTPSLTLLISLAAVSGWSLLAWRTEMESSRASGMDFCLWRCFEACHKFLGRLSRWFQNIPSWGWVSVFQGTPSSLLVWWCSPWFSSQGSQCYCSLVQGKCYCLGFRVGPYRHLWLLHSLGVSVCDFKGLTLRW